MRMTWLLVVGLAVVPLHAQQDVLVPTNIQRYGPEYPACTLVSCVRKKIL